jgi:DeoR/GlpR family transcriptional regulator of sugar metabolism
MNGERTERLRTFIEERKRVTLADIVDAFDVSPATVRRDLGALAERGEIRRVRGGAVAVRQAPPELPVVQRAANQADAKARIGKAAAELVRDDETIFLSSGTTALEVARHLRDRSGLTVLTNSLLVVNMLIDSSDIEVIALGGQLRRSEMSLIGHVAEGALRELRAAKTIFGVRAIHPQQGLTNDYLPETLTDRAILGLGGEVIVVADHTKCGRAAAAFVAPATAMDLLVTDEATPDAFVDELTIRGVRVLRV